MASDFTNSVQFWLFIVTGLMALGGYKLLTKQNASANAQNSRDIKELGTKIDSKIDALGIVTNQALTAIQMEQVKLQSSITNMNEKINRIEHDTTITRAQGNMSSESIARLDVRLNNIENKGYFDGPNQKMVN